VTPRDWLPALARVSGWIVGVLAAPAAVFGLAAARSDARRRLVLDLHMLLSDAASGRYAPALVFAAACAILIGRHPFPPDDLARDLVAWAVGFDYRRMFFGSPGLPGYDQYIGFDHLAEMAYRLLPADYVALPFQLVPLVGLLCVLWWLFSRMWEGRKERHWIVAGLLLLCLLLPGVTSRVMQGRPESWFSVFALSALVLPPRVWIILGFLLVPFYWLAPVYAGAAVLLSASWRERIVLGAVYAAGSALVWLVLSNGGWPGSFVLLVQDMRNRVAEVMENGAAVTLVAGTGSAVYAYVLYRCRHGVRWREDADLWIAICWFLLPNMSRYTSVVAPLALVLLARAVRRAAPAGPLDPLPVRVGIVWATLVLLPQAFAGHGAPNPDFLARARAGDRVLAAFDFSMYRSAFAAAPRGVSLAPAMEVGASDPVLQQMALDLAEGRLRCRLLEDWQISWVVEQSLKGAPPDCLTLDSTDGPLRAWKVESAP
jgi:hypothetical protein